jgi:hypothetical protein
MKARETWSEIIKMAPLQCSASQFNFKHSRVLKGALHLAPQLRNVITRESASDSLFRRAFLFSNAAMPLTSFEQLLL